MSSAHSYGAAARLFGPLPVVATAHTVQIQLHWALNHIVIATSAEAAEYHRRYNRVPRKALRTVPNFVDMRALHPVSDAERREARAVFGLPQDGFVVGSVGHLSERKRQIDLVPAFEPLARRHRNARLLLVGGYGSLHGEEIRQVAGDRGLLEQVILTGERSDIPTALAAMNVFALPSGQETAPLAILEAMGRGLPVIATGVGSVAELVLDARTGHIVEVGDTDAIGEHLLALASDARRREEFGAAGREHACRNFAVEVLAPRIEAILQEAVVIRNRPLLGFLARPFTGR